jgi:hypothetical protein
MSKTQMGRRAFLALAAGGVAFVLTGTRGTLGLGWARVRSASARVDGVVRLGRAYAKATPREADRDTLLRRLDGVNGNTSLRAQMPAMQGAIEADFEAERVVAVHGWWLSRTEARASAAVALGA